MDTQAIQATPEQINRVVLALEDILRVAIEVGGIARNGQDDDDCYYPAFYEAPFTTAVAAAWIKDWSELKGTPDTAEFLLPQLEQLHEWLESLRAELESQLTEEVVRTKRMMLP
jgi:hypothetical protein